MKIRWFSLVAGLAILVLGYGGGDLSALASTLSGKIAYYCAGDICRFDLSTGVDTDLTNSKAIDNHPKMSPDGTKIVFTSSGGIYVMDSNGTNRTFLSSVGGHPYWSPDGTQIAFSIISSASSDGIYVMNADGSMPTRLTTFGNWPAWSPDGTQIAFSSNYEEIWLMDVAAPSSAQRVAACSRPGGAVDVVWSPGPKILFASGVGGKNGYELFACDPGSGLTRLTTSARQDFEPSWSPDGARIAWYSGRQPAGIWVMNADGTSPQPIISGGRLPSWGP